MTQQKSLSFLLTRLLILGITLLPLIATSAAQFVPASPPTADPADARFKGVTEDFSSPESLSPSLRRQTHSDFKRADMQIYRGRLRALGGC